MYATDSYLAHLLNVPVWGVFRRQKGNQLNMLYCWASQSLKQYNC